MTAGSESVAAGATIGGTGTLSALLTITGNGIVAPGATIGSIGTLSLSSGINFGASGVYNDDINAADQSDLLAVTGNLTLGATDTLNVNVLDSTSGLNYTIATYTGTLAGTFAATSLPAGYSINYGTGSNSSITLVVPEPASVGILGVACGALLLRRRRETSRPV